MKYLTFIFVTVVPYFPSFQFLEAIEKPGPPTASTKLIHLPLARIKGIIKLDEDVSMISSEAVFAITKATELFIESLAKECYVHTSQSRKKTIQRKDLDTAISTVDQLIFLDGAIV